MQWSGWRQLSEYTISSISTMQTGDTMQASGPTLPHPGCVPFGRMPDGREVQAVTIAAGRLTLRLVTLGAAVQALWAPDRQGRLDDIVLGHDSVADYLATRTFFGSIAGRCANRIAGGRFTLDGQTYQVPCNDGPNCLHGGMQGLDLRLWTLAGHTDHSARFTYHSPAGEEGFPGALDITADYTLHGDDRLAVTLTARTDTPTIVNLTNHAYFNLAGLSANTDVLDHVLTLDADRITPVGPDLIPTGEFRNVAGTPFDFREPTAIGARIRDGRDPQLTLARGYDHNYVLNGGRVAAHVLHPGSGRALTLTTTEPGLQFYSGNFLPGSLVGKGGRLYRQADGFCLEPQHFPDTANQPHFGSVRLDPGAEYRHVSTYHFTTEPERT